MGLTRTRNCLLAAICCLVTFVSLACQASQLSHDHKSILLTFACPQEDVSAYQAAAMLFRQNHPDIDIRVVSAATLAPTGSEIPDGLTYAYQLAQRADMFLAHGAAVELGLLGAIQDLTPYMPVTGGVTDGDDPISVADYFQEQGKTWGMPAGLIPYVLILRTTDLAAISGLEPRADWTWDDLRMIANELTVRDGLEVRRYGFADHYSISLRALLVAHGLVPEHRPEATTSFALNDTRLVEVVQWYTDLALKDHVMPNPATNPSLDSWNMFSRGEVAMAVLPMTRWLQVSLQAPAGTRVMRLPEATPVEPLGYFVSARAPNSQAAWRFIEFVQQRVVPVGALPFSRHRLSAVARSTRDQDRRQLLLQMLERPALPFRPAKVNEILHDAVRRIWAGGAVETELARAQQAIATINRAAPRETPGLLGATLAGTAKENINFLVQEKAPYLSLAQSFQDTSGIGVNLLTMADFLTSIPTAEGIQVQPTPLSELIRRSGADCFEGLGWDDRWDEIAAVSLDLRPLLDTDGDLFIEDFYSQAMRQFTDGGHVWGLPIGMKVPVLQYNQDFFDATDTAYPSAGWTWQDVFAIARQLSVGAGPSRRYGFVLWPDLRLVGQIQRMTGVSWIDLETRPHTVHLNAPEIVSAAETLAELARDDVIPSISGSDTPEIMLSDLIFSGRVAMWPAESQDFRYSPFRLGAARLPGERLCCPLGSACAMQTLHISRQTIHVPACWQWLRFLSQQPATSAFTIPVRRSVLASSVFGQQVGSETQTVYLEAAECDIDGPSAGWDALPEGAFHTLTLLASALEQIVWHGADGKSTLDEAQKKADAYLACLRRCTDAADADDANCAHVCVIQTGSETEKPFVAP